MSLRAAIAKAAISAFTALGDIAVSAVYRRTTSGYNAATGIVTATNSDLTIIGVFTKYTELEISRSVGLQVTDQKFTVLQADLGMVPNIQTDHVVYGGKTYNIVNYVPDPAGATISLQLRAP